MNNIRALCKLTGTKQTALAKAINTSQSCISDWVNEKTGPSFKNLIDLANYFDVTVGCVVGTEPIPEGYPDCYTIPASYTEVMKKHPAEPKAAEPESTFIDEPFSAEQLAYLNKRLEEFAKQIRNDNKKGV